MAKFTDAYVCHLAASVSLFTPFAPPPLPQAFV